jgi:DHA1 family tetracycline resistance protein-like MFS transporter
VLLALAGSFFWILISRIISGIGAGSVGTAQSYVADVTRKSQREQAYAIYGAVFGAAFIVGPAMAGFLQRRGLQFPFFFAVLLELLDIGLTLWLLPNQSRMRHRETTIRESALAAWRPLIRRVLVRQFLFVFAVVYLLADFALYLHHWLRLDTADVSWLLAITGVIGGVTMVLGVAPATRRFGDRQVAQFGLTLLFIAYVLIYFVRNLMWFFPVLVLWAIGATMVEPTLMAMLSRRAPSEERGAIMGVSDGVNSAALILAPAIGTAIVGYDARLIGMLPALAVAMAWVIGRKPIEPRAAHRLH